MLNLFGHITYSVGWGVYFNAFPSQGSNTAALNRIRQLVLQILSSNGPCAQFFNVYAKDYEYQVDSVLSSSTPAADIFLSLKLTQTEGTRADNGSGITQNGDGTESQPWAARTSQGTGWGSTVGVNTAGAFFLSSAFINGSTPTRSGPLTIGGTANPRQYSGTYPDARITILLHELAHTIDAIPSDSDSSKQSLANTQTILDHCKSEIEAAAKKH